MSPEAAFQSAVVAALGEDSALAPLIGDPARIYDAGGGQGAIFPYLVCGRGESEPFDGEGASLIDHRLSLHAWGRRDDRDDLRAILGAVRSALHGARLDMDAPHRCVVCRVVYADLFEGTDGRSLHALVRLRALIEATAK